MGYQRRKVMKALSTRGYVVLRGVLGDKDIQVELVIPSEVRVA